MDPIMVWLVSVIILTLIFDYINGFHDAANAIATVVATKVLRPMTAVIFGAVLNFVGALMGTAVATTIGSGLVAAELITLQTVFFTVLSAIIWNIITWIKALPTSSSHAIMGSLVGAALASNPGTWDSVHWKGIYDKVFVPMISSPLMGFFLGLLIMWSLIWMFYRLNRHKINRIFDKLQIVSAGFMALTHGHNDAQKSMGIMALALVLAFPQNEFHVPLWVIIICATAMALGTMSGGWRIIQTMGHKMIRLQPIHGFAAETTASIIIGGASHLGIPVSTTQVISSSILGVGASRGLSAVRWGVVRRILWAWVLTLPMTAAFSYAMVTIYRMFINI
jgi:PiT family inorganic phosphate transporter